MITKAEKATDKVFRAMDDETDARRQFVVQKERDLERAYRDIQVQKCENMIELLEHSGAPADTIDREKRLLAFLCDLASEV